MPLRDATISITVRATLAAASGRCARVEVEHHRGGRVGGVDGGLVRVQLERGEVTALVARLTRLSTRGRVRIGGLKAERADTILAGVVVIDELMALGDWRTLTVSPHGVRHGILIRETFGEAAGA